MRYKTPFIWVDDKPIIDEALATHIWERLGITPSLFRAWVAELFPRSSIAFALLATRAFDNAYGTSHSDGVSAIQVDLPDFCWDEYLAKPQAPWHKERLLHVAMASLPADWLLPSK